MSNHSTCTQLCIVWFWWNFSFTTEVPVKPSDLMVVWVVEYVTAEMKKKTSAKGERTCLLERFIISLNSVILQLKSTIFYHIL